MSWFLIDFRHYWPWSPPTELIKNILKSELLKLAYLDIKNAAWTIKGGETEGWGWKLAHQWSESNQEVLYRYQIM